MLSNGKYQYISCRSAYFKKVSAEEAGSYLISENNKRYLLYFTREEERIREDKLSGWYLVKGEDEYDDEVVTKLYSLSHFQQILSFGYIGLGVPLDEDREGLRAILSEWPTQRPCS